MDRERFDRLARLLGTRGSRRDALGALLGAALLGIDADPEDGLAKAKKGKGRGKSKGKGKGRDGGVSAQGKKKKGGKNQGRQPAPADDAGSAGIDQAARAGGKCCGARSCARPVNGGNYEECDYSGQNLAGVKAVGANMQKVNGQGTIFSTLAKKSNFQGAHFGRNAISACLQRSKWAGANLKNANFDAACFFDADLSGAIINNGTNLGSAKFCRTRMPDGSINNRDCAKGTPCCAACDATNTCPSGQVCCEGKCIKGSSCCIPDCRGKECGSDGCGGNCGTCDAARCLTCGTGQKAGICISTCDKCQQCDGKGVCKPKCSKCETCDANGDCKPKCGNCQTCDSYGTCVDKCTKCQTCDKDGRCIDKCTRCQSCEADGSCKDKCTRCQTCEADGTCKDKCTRCQSCEADGSCKDKCSRCQTCEADGSCKDKCTRCQSCEADGSCKDKCTRCQTCEADGSCKDKCTKCQTCEADGSCKDKCDSKLCETCNADGQCVTTCDPKLCLKCGTGGDAGTCVSTCGACQQCDGKGMCEGSGETCGDICVECPQAYKTRTFHEGNPAECPGGVKRENPSAGQCEVITRNCGGGKTCKFRYCISDNKKRLSVSPVDGETPCKIDTIIVKGGDDAYIYTFDPVAVCAEGLVAPLNNGGNRPDISNFQFCGIGCC